MQSLVELARGIVNQAISLSNGRLARGTILSVAIVGIGTILGYLVQIFIARSLGPVEFGTYVYVLGWVGIARLVTTLSYDLAAVRYVGIFFAENDWARIKGFMRTSRWSVAIAGLHAVLGIALLVHIFKDQLPSHLPNALLVGCLLLLPIAFLSLESSYLRAMQFVFAARVPFSIVRPLILAAGLFVATAYLGYAGTAVLALYANTIGTMIAFIISVVLLQRHVPSQVTAFAPAADRKDWATFCAANLGQTLLYMILSQQSDIILVGTLIGTTEAGHYAAAGQIASILMLGVNAVNEFVNPMIAGHKATPSDHELARVLSRATLLNMAIALPIVAVIVLLGPWMLSLFGPTFPAAYPVVLILTISGIFGGLWGGLWGDLLTMRGLYRSSTLVVVTATAFNLVLMYVLAPRFGIVGAAAATTIAVIVRSALVAILVHHHFGFWPWTIWRQGLSRAGQDT